MPDGLAAGRVELDRAVVLPGVEQPVVLCVARHAFIGLVCLDVLSHGISEALGHEPDRPLEHPPCRTVAVQRELCASLEHGPHGLHQQLDERHGLGRGEAGLGAFLQGALR